MCFMNEVTSGTNYKHGSQHSKLQGKAPQPKGSGENVAFKNHPGRQRGGKVNDPREKGSHLGGGKI